jgi:23S rRNA (uracil1939-C5)-methyltransferase
MAKNSKRVFGIDIVEESIVCAKQNAKANGIENADFAATDAGVPENIKKCLTNAGIALSKATVVIDPPRKGSTPELISFLAKEKVQRVVYISCNPDTLARDCKLFVELGYSLGDIQPVNMFPRTGHVESIVCLTRKSGGNQ